VFIEAKDDGGGGDNWATGAINRAKLQSNHHHQQINIQFFLTGRTPVLSPTNSVKALKGESAQKLRKEFPGKSWNECSLLRLLRT